MIKALELRIGNIVMSAGTGELHPIAIKAHQIAQLCEYPEYAAAIPLTPEILDKCGFVNGEIRHSYYLHLLVEKYTTATQGWINNAWRVVLLGGVPHALGHQFHYLHQLQNLFFALTGKELNISM